MNLADKINLHAKVGSLTGITFNEEETAIYDLCKKAVTFRDAVDAAKALYEYCKEHNEDTDCMSDDHDMMGQEWEESEDGEEMEFEMSSSGEETDGEDSENDDSSDDSCEDGEDGSGNEESKDGEDSDNNSENSDVEGGGEKTDETANSGGTGGIGEMTNPIQAETVLNWEQNKEDLNDDTGRDYFYMNVPESDLDSVIDYKKCLESLREHYKSDNVYGRS